MRGWIDMLTNGEVTIFCPDENQEEYIVRATVPAWVRHQMRLRDQGNGVRRVDTFDIRIKLDLVDCIEPGDIIFFGKTEVADLKRCRQVAAVRKNAYGSVPHWHLEAEYMYR